MVDSTAALSESTMAARWVTTRAALTAHLRAVWLVQQMAEKKGPNWAD